MTRVSKLDLRDVRCFAGEQSARLARITLLVGPNGAGKSTFLGCYKTLTSLANLHELTDKNYFNRPPFHMGGFNTIVRTDCSDFSVGGDFTDHCHDSVHFDFISGAGGDPQEKSAHIRWQKNNIDIFLQGSPHETLRFDSSRFSFLLNRSHISYNQISTWLSRAVRYGYFPFNGDMATFRRQGQSSVTGDEVIAFSKFLSFFRSEFPLLYEPALNVFAIDPSPEPRQRFYNDRPQLLGDGDQEAIAFLAKIGERLGLWKNIKIHSGNQGFEVMVYTAGGTYNLQDVGYGVHSMLPLARALYEQPPHAVLLLQQPEVHLHPEAQANLAQIMVESQQSFIIETHSDHFLDRFQICVTRDLLPPDDISILYFEPLNGGNGTAIHSIEIDGAGNLSDVPKNYRKFFQQETNALLGFDD